MKNDVKNNIQKSYCSFRFSINRFSFNTTHKFKCHKREKKKVIQSAKKKFMFYFSLQLNLVLVQIFFNAYVRFYERVCLCVRIQVYV